MPIRIVVRESLNCPVVFCDHCQEEIKVANQGNYEWRYAEAGPSEVFFTHKGCSKQFRQEHSDVKMSDELRLFPAYLSKNLEIDPKSSN